MSHSRRQSPNMSDCEAKMSEWALVYECGGVWRRDNCPVNNKQHGLVTILVRLGEGLSMTGGHLRALYQDRVVCFYSHFNRPASHPSTMDRGRLDLFIAQHLYDKPIYFCRLLLNHNTQHNMCHIVSYTTCIYWLLMVHIPTRYLRSFTVTKSN